MVAPLNKAPQTQPPPPKPPKAKASIPKPPQVAILAAVTKRQAPSPRKTRSRTKKEQEQGQQRGNGGDAVHLRVPVAVQGGGLKAVQVEGIDQAHPKPLVVTTAQMKIQYKRELAIRSQLTCLDSWAYDQIIDLTTLHHLLASSFQTCPIRMSWRPRDCNGEVIGYTHYLLVNHTTPSTRQPISK